MFAQRCCAALAVAVLCFCASLEIATAAPEVNRARKLAFEADAASRPTLAVVIPNTNDLCANAVTITTGTFTGTTSFATNDGQDSCEGQNDVWFAFTPSVTRSFAISTSGSTFDTVIALYSSCPGTLANLLNCADDVGTEELLYAMQAGVTYRIRLSGYQGEQGSYTLTVGDSNEQIGSEFVNIALDSSGNFTIGVQGQTAESTYDLLFGHPNPWSGGTTLRVDGVDFTNMNNAELGTQVSAPLTQPDGSSLTVWEASGVRLTQRLSVVEGQSGNRDNVVMEYTATNISAQNRSVGIRIFFDTYLGSNDGVPFRVPGLGTVLFERERYGEAVPPYWTSFESLANPERQSQGSLVTAGMRSPDRVVWGAWPTMFDTAWDYVINPNASVTQDSAVGIYWNPTLLGPGQSMTIGTSYGKSAINADFSPPLTTALLAPPRLANVENQYAPNPWVLNLFIEHSAPGVLNTVNNVRAELILPEGLVSQQPEMVNLGNIQPSASAEVEWTVEAWPQILQERATLSAGGASTVSMPYSVKIYADGYPTKQLSRTLELPYLHTNVQSWALYR